MLSDEQGLADAKLALLMFLLMRNHKGKRERTQRFEVLETGSGSFQAPHTLYSASFYLFASHVYMPNALVSDV